MSILAWIEDQKRLKLLNAPKYVNPASDSSKGLWTRCDKCGVILYIKHLKENQRVCFGCSYHLQMSSQERVENLLDKNTWRPLDETVSPCDPLEFHDQKDYTDRLQEAQERTGLQDAIQTGSGMVDGIPIALGVMDFDFMGGSMGSVVGEKITRLIEYATQEGLVLVLVSASGGARMQEGVLSLMQMAKISSALQVYQKCAHLLYISILTSPTTGGVTASFAMLGDIIFAEPKALIAFAGRRVIEQTLCEDLPEDFQTSEYMLHHGLLDLIVPRRFLRQALSESIRLYKNAPFQKAGRIPFGVQNPITFVLEEKIRRQLSLEKDPVEETSANLWDQSAELPSTRENRQTHSSERAGGNTNIYNGVLSQKGLNRDKLDVGERANRIEQGDTTPLKNQKNRDDASHSLSSKALSGESAPPENSIHIPPSREHKDSDTSSLQNKNGSTPLAARKDSMFSLLRRETGEYREILTSFQTMFYLFSKESAVPYSQHENKDREEFEKDERRVGEIDSYAQRKGVTPQSLQKGESVNIFSKRESVESKEKQNGHLFLHNFMTLSEGKNTNTMLSREHISKVYPHDTSESKKDFHSGKMANADGDNSPKTENAKHLEKSAPSTYRDASPSPENRKQLFASPPAYIDFFNQSIELAATESVEWRAFYVYQSVSQETGFLEDFMKSFHEDAKGNQQSSSQNMLFYRSICRQITSTS